MLSRDPNERFSVDDVLQHPWLSGSENASIGTPTHSITGKTDAQSFAYSSRNKRPIQEIGTTNNEIRVNAKCGKSF